MIRPWLTVLSIAFALNACVSTGTLQARKEPDVLQRRVQTWLGMPRDFLEKYWGLAKNTKDMGMGLRYLTYEAKGKKACAVVFTVDISNTIKGGEWSGDRASCLRFVREVPSLSAKQELVDVKLKAEPEPTFNYYSPENFRAHESPVYLANE